MGTLDQKQRHIENIVRLRRAERTSPARDEISVVRADLASIVGPTVTRAMSARLLGVSQTALDRWVAEGDVAVVITPAGRREVPLQALVQLLEAVRERRGSEDGRHPLAAVLRQRRSDAQRLDLRNIARVRPRDHGALGGHRPAELRSLAYHRAVAAHLDDQLVRDALERVRRWRAEARIDPRVASDWEAVLARPLPEIARLLGRDTERARDLRQSSPFAGALSEPERRRVLEAVDSA